MAWQGVAWYAMACRLTARWGRRRGACGAGSGRHCSAHFSRPPAAPVPTAHARPARPSTSPIHAPNPPSLGYLVNKNRPDQLQEVVAALCDKLCGSSKDQLRDVASLGLKTVVMGALQ